MRPRHFGAPKRTQLDRNRSFDSWLVSARIEALETNVDSVARTCRMDIDEARNLVRLEKIRRETPLG